MPTITLTYTVSTQAVLDRILDDLALAFNYDLLGGGLTKAQYVRKVVRDFMISNCRRVEGQVAQQQAQSNAGAQIDIT